MNGLAALRAIRRRLTPPLIVMRALDAVALGLVRLYLRMSPPRSASHVRSLWTGTPIINLAINAKSERILGVETCSLVDHAYFITNQFDINMRRWVLLPVIGYVTQFVILAWAARRFDRFHFYCDRGILRARERFRFHPGELALLKSLGKQIFFWTYGADVRTRRTTHALGEVHYCRDCPGIRSSCVCDDETWAAYFENLRRNATAVFSMGDMIEYTPGSRNDLFFWPVDLDANGGRKYRPVYPPAAGDRPLRIVHAPNHRHFKGTRFLLAAVERLQARGVAVELKLVERVPNAEALEIYRSADVVFDQCTAGFHGYFAIEALALGKPVMCYIRKPQEYLLHPDECPIINTSPSTLEADIENLVRRRSELMQIGRRGRVYIEKYYTLAAFAARLDRTYRELGFSAGAEAANLPQPEMPEVAASHFSRRPMVH